MGQAIVRAGLAVYFRRLEVSGLENVPAAGPVILASNHPQSITDALVLAALAPRAVRFLAHGGLFENRFRGWLLRACGAIPVYRAGDAPDAAQRNIRMFSACENVLEKGGAIGIFPEGVSTEDRRIHKLKTGTARIALDTEAKNGWRLGIAVVPVGLVFESRRRMRTRVLVEFGRPISAGDYRGVFESDPAGAALGLSGALRDALTHLVVDIERPEFEDLVREVELVYKRELLEREGERAGERSKFEESHLLSVEIPRVLDFFLEREPEVVRRVRRLLKEYHGALERAKVRDELLADPKKRTLGGEIARLAVLGAAGLPLAAYGVLWNFVPYKFAGFVAHGASRDETKIHYHQLVYGAFLFPLWYAPPLFLAWRVLGPLGTLIFAVSLPASGLFALGYARWTNRRRRMIRFGWLRMTHGRFVRALERRRRLVIREMDLALAEYLAAQLDAKPAKLEGEGDGAR
jgi:glycerol-3-phosphate O-acyltransferase/dihydroxyacetone phosphate acyltransferase